MVITVGKIGIDKIKEAITNTGMHSDKSEESLSAGDASFTIKIAEFISNFNREEGIILKNLPDGLLNDEQREIKERVLAADEQKEVGVKIRLSPKEVDQLESQGFTKGEIETVIRHTDNITKIRSARIDDVRNKVSIQGQGDQARSEPTAEIDLFTSSLDDLMHNAVHRAQEQNDDLNIGDGKEIALDKRKESGPAGPGDD